MMIALPNVLDPATLGRVLAIIAAGEWADGNRTSGHQSALAKRNRQLPEEGAAAREAGRLILEALSRTPLFIAAALPSRIFPPLFNAYGPGEQFATHVDNAVRIRRFDDFRIRSDLSATLFLSDPDSYDGGALVVEDRFGTQEVKLPAGHMVLYPASSLHHVTPVTRGERLASFFWIQSMVRDDGARSILLDLDSAVQDVAAERGSADRTVISLTGVYHNLLRRWAEV